MLSDSSHLIIGPAHHTHRHVAGVALRVVVARGGRVGALLKYVVQEPIINVDVVLLRVVTGVIPRVLGVICVCVCSRGQLTHDAGAGLLGGAQPGLGGALGHPGQERPRDAGGAPPPPLTAAPVQHALAPPAPEIGELGAGVAREALALETGDQGTVYGLALSFSH